MEKRMNIENNIKYRIKLINLLHNKFKKLKVDY